MAYEEEVTSEYTLDFTFDELQDAFSKLLIEFKKFGWKNKDLKKVKS